jgi:hypothetical protein
MYLWNINKLALDLANSKVNEKAGMQYFLASTLLILFQTYYAMWWGVERGWLFFFEFTLLAIISIFGCMEAFKANGSEAGNNFIMRVICLSVPAGIRVAFFSLVFGELLVINAQSIFSPSSFANPWQAFTIVSYAGFIGFSIMYWWLIYDGFRQIHNNQKSKQ